MHASAQYEKSWSRTVLIRDLHRDNNYHGPGERVITGGIVRLSFLRCTRRRRNSTYFTRQSLARTRSRHVFTLVLFYIYIYILCMCVRTIIVCIIIIVVVTDGKSCAVDYDMA